MSRFFIDRPIFAWVMAIVIMLGGGLAILNLPVSQYPAIAPPSISVTAIYPGASAQTLENTVTQIIEQQMKGLDHLEYLSSTSDSSGQVVVTLTFAQGANPDIAQVQVQNKLQLATPLLPTQVQQQGLVVAKATRNFLLVIALYSADDSHNGADLGDYIVSNIQDPLSRVSGVGDTQVFGGQYAMRIWLDPYKLNSVSLTTSGREGRHRGAERPGLGRADRRLARRARTAAERGDHRPVAPADALSSSATSCCTPTPTAPP